MLAILHKMTVCAKLLAVSIEHSRQSSSVTSTIMLYVYESNQTGSFWAQDALICRPGSHIIDTTFPSLEDSACGRSESLRQN